MFNGRTAAAVIIGILLCANNFAIAKSPAMGQKKHLFSREFYQVSEGLFCGSEPTSEADILRLKSLGIKTIIDLRFFGFKAEEQWAKTNAIDYHHIPTGVVRPDCQRIDQVMEMVQNPKYLPVYLHCRTGCDRTGVIVGLYHIYKQGWSREEAYKDMREHHFRKMFFGLKKTFDDYAGRPQAKEELPPTSWVTPTISHD